MNKNLMKNKRKVLGGVLALLVVLGLGIAWYLRPVEPLTADSKSNSASRDTATPIVHFPPGSPQLSYLRIEAVVALPVPLIEPIPGRIAYDDDVTARVFSPVSARIIRPLAGVGDTVKAGQGLALLDVPDYADLAKNESDRRTKAAAYRRARELHDAEVLARRDLESAENDLRAAEAESSRAHTRLRSLAPVSGGIGLVAPRAGIVTERLASPGLEVRPDAPAPLYVVTDPGRVWAVAELTEKDLGKIAVGQPVAISVDAYPEQRFPGKVMAVGDVLDAQTRRVVVRCSVENSGRKLKPEMFARISPESSQQKLPRVPNHALVTEGLSTYLFVETAPGVLERRRVTLAFRGVDTSYVAEGLAAGERLVTTGAILLNAELAGN